MQTKISQDYTKKNVLSTLNSNPGEGLATTEKVSHLTGAIQSAPRRILAIVYKRRSKESLWADSQIAGQSLRQDHARNCLPRRVQVLT
eukprot:5540581-Ditylum_brightwellii.AAC.1